MSKILKYKILLGTTISLFSLVFIFLLISTFFPLINSDWSFNDEFIIIIICSISLGILIFIAVYYADKIKELKRKWKRNN